MVVPAIWHKEYRLQFPCLAGLTVIYQIALPLASLNTQFELPASRGLGGVPQTVFGDGHPVPSGRVGRYAWRWVQDTPP